MKRETYRSRDSYAQVNWDMVKEVGGDFTLAVVFDWLAWKADPAYDGVTDAHGNVWYPTSIPALAATMNTSEKVIRRALEELVKRGHLESAQLHLGGAYDRTKAYRPLWETPNEDDAQAAMTAGDEQRGDLKPSALQGRSTCPTGPITSAPEGRSHLPYRADVPLLETVKELTNKDLTLSDELEPPPARDEIIDQLFGIFWQAWPRKVERKDARRAFEKALTAVTGHRTNDLATLGAAGNTLTVAAMEWANQWQQVEHRSAEHIPHAASWLNGERWTDELPVAGAPPGHKPTAFERNLALTRQLQAQETHNEPRRDQPALDHSISDRPQGTHPR